MNQITAKDVYDALADQLTGGCGYISDRAEDAALEFKSVTVDGIVDCRHIADFLNSRHQQA